MSAITLGEAAIVVSVLVGAGGLAMGGLKLSAQLGRVLQKMEHMAGTVEDHEVRIRKVERRV
jgi:hypothetical protein